MNWEKEKQKRINKLLSKMVEDMVISGASIERISPRDFWKPKPDILSGAVDPRTDPLFGHKLGFIPFAYHLIPVRGLAKVAAVMRCGERKGRSADDWKRVPVEEHLNHAISHLMAFLSGAQRGEHHLANAGCRILMALALDDTEVLPDPVYEPEPEQGTTTGPQSGDSVPFP